MRVGGSLLTLSRRGHASCLSSRRLISYLDRRGLDSINIAAQPTLPH